MRTDHEKLLSQLISTKLEKSIEWWMVVTMHNASILSGSMRQKSYEQIVCVSKGISWTTGYASDCFWYSWSFQMKKVTHTRSRQRNLCS